MTVPPLKCSKSTFDFPDCSFNLAVGLKFKRIPNVIEGLISDSCRLRFVEAEIAKTLRKLQKIDGSHN
jgi:hypothetical protein